jgi:hypothetical protein
MLRMRRVRSLIELMLTPAVTTGHVMSMDELANVKGRGWEDIDVRGMSPFLFARLERKLTWFVALIMQVRRSSGHAGTVRLVYMHAQRR